MMLNSYAPNRIRRYAFAGLAIGLLTVPAMYAGDGLARASSIQAALGDATFTGFQVLASAAFGLATLLAVVGYRHARLSRQLAGERARAETLHHAARHDSLTGLRNRHALSEDAAALCTGAAGKRMAALLFDLDRFKLINDTLGHAAGDEVLKVLGARIAEACHPDQLVYRLGGDEFVVLWRDAPCEAAIGRFCKRLSTAVFRPVDFGQGALDTAGSIGIALSEAGPFRLSDLLKRADLALYRAKETPGLSHSFFSEEMDSAYRIRRDLEADMRSGLHSGAFGVEYMPVYRPGMANPAMMRPSGFTARLTWRHPEHGVILPESFMPVAEESGLILMIGKWMLGEVLLAAQSWGKTTEVVVPVSPAQLAEPGFSDLVISMLAKTGIAPHRLVCDVCTSAIPESNVAALSAIARLRTAGVKIAVSEFSAGIAGLAMTRPHRVDRVRLDLARIRAIAGEDRLGHMLGLFLQLAGVVDTVVTVTGVDTSEDLECARAAGAAEVEGRIAGPVLDRAGIAAMFSGTEALLAS
ncbi:MAG: EAL domain-containing protein [Hoeflea sp.]|uniref:diguanylate cyclase domain-containing protein n=1 Tax=Hoeflea sp. TaxID=1940281 RepID=UPI0032EE88E6